MKFGCPLMSDNVLTYSITIMNVEIIIYRMYNFNAVAYISKNISNLALRPVSVFIFNIFDDSKWGNISSVLNYH